MPSAIVGLPAIALRSGYLLYQRAEAVLPDEARHDPVPEGHCGLILAWDAFQLGTSGTLFHRLSMADAGGNVIVLQQRVAGSGVAIAFDFAPTYILWPRMRLTAVHDGAAGSLIVSRAFLAYVPLEAMKEL